MPSLLSARARTRLLAWSPLPAVAGIALVTAPAGAAVAVPVAPLAAARTAGGQAGTPPPKAPPRPSPNPRPSPVPQQAPPPNCTPQRGAVSPGSAVPWPEQRLNFTEAWQFTRGNGVAVAVVDTGVSTSAQLPAWRVTEQTVTATGTADCDGHGTAVAGIIAAARQAGNPFWGVAPGTHIISVKFADSNRVDCGSLAAAIGRAATEASIINVSSQCPDTPVLRDAVGSAFAHGVVVVAAAGNDQPGQGTGPFYPASYSADPAVFPNVISVGAVQPDGSLPDFYDPHTNVSVVAPGQGVLTLAPDRTFRYQNGTSFAAPFVAGVAALVKASHPGLTAGQIVRRIIATADGATAAGTGAGMVDPVQAVTAVLPGKGQGAPAPTPARSVVSVPRPPAADRFGRVLTMSVTGGALATAILVVAGAVVVPAGRRRNWRPGRRNEQHKESPRAVP